MARRFVVRVIAVVLIGLVTMTGVASAASRQGDDAPSFTAVDLGAIKDYPGTALFAMNAKGVIVGQGFEPTTYRSRAVIYRNEKIRALIKGETGSSSAQDINASNQIVGYTMEDMGSTKATLWDGEEATALVESEGSSLALAINDEGVVVGWVADATGYPNPYVWVDGEVTSLPLLAEGNVGAALNINAEGVIVGYSYVEPMDPSGNIPSHATLWTDGEATDLGTVGGDFSEALGINAGGQIVGRSTTGPDQYDRSSGSHATLWDGDEIVDLGTLEDGETSVAAAINGDGQIVGHSLTAPDQSSSDGSAFLWLDGTMYDLNELIDGEIDAVLYYAYDINDDGLIVASGRVDGVEHAFLLTPVEA